MCKSGVLITKRELMRLFQVGPEVRAVRAELLVEVGRTARLGCEVRGYPAPGTGWYKDDRGDYRDLQHWLIIKYKYTFFIQFHFNEDGHVYLVGDKYSTLLSAYE